MNRLEIDIETRSVAPLPKTGVYVYAEHPTTEITHVAYSRDAASVRVWLPPRSTQRDTSGVRQVVTTASGRQVEAFGGPMPADLYEALNDPAVELVAHNASFERNVLGGAPGRRIGVPVHQLAALPRWNCTAARAACMGLPRTLESTAAALNLPVQKDREGYALMMRMCKPKPKTGVNGVPPVWVDDPASMLREAAYCADDVHTEAAVDAKLPNLPGLERQVWEITEAMNDAGVVVDTDLLLRVSLMIEDAERDINARISGVTGGAVPRVSDHGALTRWLLAQGLDDTAETGVGKQAVAAMLERADLDPVVRSVLAMRRDGGGSSAKKYRAILTRLSNDGRLRGALVYAGAAMTARWSSRGAQLQNLPRGGTIRSTDGAIRDLMDGASLAEIEEIHGPPLVVASELLRPVFTAAEGYWLARGDYSQIEARVIAWMAGAEWKLDAFRACDAGTGPDTYKLAAASIYRVAVPDVTKEQRQIGKVGELALGFQGGVGAFQQMAKGYGVRVGDDRADEIKVAWREANPEVVQLWRDMERAAIDCMESSPGRFWPVGTRGMGYKRNGAALALRLPSGRHMLYWSPRLAMKATPWGSRATLVYRAEDPVKKRWTEFDAYGGLLTQGPVQATARDLMADALVRLPAAGFRPVLTVHDEGIGEAARQRFATTDEAKAAIAAVMMQAPAWAAGLPVAADASAALRYVKA